MIHKQFDERIEVVFTLGANAFQTVTTVKRTLYAAENTFFAGGEETFLFNLCQQIVSFAQNFLCSLLNDTVLLELYFIAEMSAVIEDVLLLVPCVSCL